ncbi:MAG: A/G-specific adenine glycosylase [Bacteroidota bacterium]
MNEEFFRRILLNWYSYQNRNLPWKNIKDPYKIWLSEIILQQTRVAQGLPYYEKFVEKYPTIKDFALAKDDDVMRIWQGLGYYSRARNMLTTARIIHEKYHDKFPETYHELIQLKGVGSYTAAAIASFAFDLPHAVIDGNVFRVLSRIFGIETAIDTTQGKKQFTQLAEKLLDKKHLAKYNQALMDFGATQCTPKNPNCSECVFTKTCEAFKLNLVNNLPFKEKKIEKRNRYFNFFYLTDGKNIVIQKRTEKDIWQDLYQLPLIETKTNISKEKITKPSVINQHVILEKLKPKQKLNIQSGIVKQQVLTHQNLFIQFYMLKLQSLKIAEVDGFEIISIKDINNYGFPKSIAEFLSGLKEMVLF